MVSMIQFTGFFSGSASIILYHNLRRYGEDLAASCQGTIATLAAVVDSNMNNVYNKTTTFIA
jgi:hypothetical protein